MNRLAWRRKFAETVRKCWREVAGLPKGMKKKAFAECMRRELRE